MKKTQTVNPVMYLKRSEKGWALQFKRPKKPYLAFTDPVQCEAFLARNNKQVDANTR